MVSAFVDKNTEQATLALQRELENVDFPKDLAITINNLEDAESGILLKDGKVVDISLAHCFTLQDVIREMARLIMEPRYREWDEVPKL